MPKEVVAHPHDPCYTVQEMGIATFRGPNSSKRNSVTLIELTVSCRKLADRDVFSKSDPMCVLHTMPCGKDKWVKFGCTETIRDDLNPNFVKKFVMEYYFEEQQKLKFEVVDIDCKSTDLRRHDYLGNAEFTLAEIVGSYGAVTKQLNECTQTKTATILVSAEELSFCKEEVELQFCGNNLDKKDTIGLSDPFLLFYRTNEDHTDTVVHKTEVIKNNLNPRWKVFTIPVRALCNGDYNRTLKVECYDWDRDGSHDLIGEFSTTVEELSVGQGHSNVYQCINRKKEKKKKGYKDSGTIKLLTFKVNKFDSYLDHIKGGTKIHCTIAVDFTKSNGDVTSPSSLHYTQGSQPSMYEEALRAVGEIVQEYSSDEKQFQALGFGAKVPPDGKLSHEFFMNGHPMNPYCRGIDGVVDAYFNTLLTVQMDGPTHFAPIIRRVAKEARNDDNGKNYYILLIFTDDIVSDMPQTVEAIVRASTLPLSIIIVGIGKADFTEMKVLDGDEKRLFSRGREADRDIVQFVLFREFMKEGQMCQSRAALAKEVLAEIPDQFLLYMRKHNYKPKVRQTRPLPTPLYATLF